jgi:TonB family protein
MFRFLTFIPFFFLALCCACPTPGPRTPQALLTARALPDSLDLFRAAGDKAALVMLVRPERWKQATSTLKPILSGLDPILDQTLGAPDPMTAIAGLAGEGSMLSGGLDGWDMSRPVVMAWFEPQSNDLVLAARAVIPSFDLALEKGVPGFRHRMLIPATDPRLLTASLGDLLTMAGLQERSAGNLPPGARLFEYLSGPVCLIPVETAGKQPGPGGGHVRIEILTHGVFPPGDKAAALSAWIDSLSVPVAFDLPVTPALLAAVSRPDLLTVHVRPWQYRDLASQFGTMQLLQALSFADPSMKAMLLARGLSIVAWSSLMMSPVGSELDDFTLSMDLNGGLRIGGTGSLTAIGERIFKAGLTVGPAPMIVDKEIPILSLWTRMDLNAMIQAAPIPESLAEVKKLEELAEAFMECGSFCYLHYVTRTPIGLARTLMDLLPENLSGQLPRSFSLALLANDPSRDLSPVRIAATARLPASANTRLLRQGLADYDRMLTGSARSKLFVQPAGPEQVVQVGLGVDPREVFVPSTAPVSQGTLGEWTLDPDALIQALGGPDPRFLSVMSHFGPVRGRSVLGTRSVSGEILVDIKGRPALSFQQRIVPSNLDWDSPGAAEASTRGAKCMREVTRSMVKGFGALASVDPAQRSRIMAQLLEELEAPLGCAVGEPDTREAARRTRLMLTMFVTDGLERDFYPEAELAVLEKACAQGHPEACERAERVKSRPPIRLVNVESDCRFASTGERTIVRIPDREHLEALPTFEATQSPSDSPLALAIDENAKYDRVTQILDQIAAEREGVEVLVRGDYGNVLAVALALESGPGKADDAAHPIVLRVSGQTVSLAADGSVTIFHAGKECPEETSCMNIDDLKEAIRENREQLGKESQTYLEATPETRFEEIAGALAVAACGTSQNPWDQDLPPRVIFGPVDKDRWDRAATVHVTGRNRPEPTGLAALLGGRDAEGGIIGLGGLGTRGKTGKSPLPKTVTITPGKQVVRGSLDKEIIHRVIRRDLNKIRYCYEKRLVENPELAGKVRISFVIAADGRVQSAKIKESTLEDPVVGKCVAYAVRRLQFPKPKGGGIVIVDYPFVFKTAK